MAEADGKYDFIVVGGGIIGLSTGMALIRRCPGGRVLILEKENSWAFHQSGHNSGVVHSGIYYKPGSLKAKFAKDGNLSMVRFCQEHGIKHEVCGKVIVATEPRELPMLDNLYQRGLANGLDVAMIGPVELKEIEPHANGLAAIRVPSTGIVDFRQVAECFAAHIKKAGGDMRLGAKVETISKHRDGVVLETIQGTFHGRRLINCAGLHSDRIAKLASAKIDVKIVPFRGEYYQLRPDRRNLVKNLIYPVPNPRFPFLGVHFTRMIDGEVHAGPNAVLSFKREGYKKTDFNLKDFTEIITYPGLWRLGARNLPEGIKEVIRACSKTAFLRSLQRLVPEVRSEDIVAAEAGVRAQALTRTGETVDDFMIVQDQTSIHVCNAPSPAATASIEIGKFVAELALEIADYQSTDGVGRS